MIPVTRVTRGVEPVRVAIENHLKLHVPEIILQAREAWGLQPEKLPVPQRYDVYDPWQVQEYPVIGAYAQRTTGFRRLNNKATGSLYWPTYSMQVAVWAEDPRWNGAKYTDPTPEGSLRLRDDLVAVVRAGLLEYPNLGQPEIFSLDEGTYTETYFEPAKSMGEENWLSGGLLSFQVRVNENALLEGQVVGSADDVTLTMDLVGPDQAFASVG